MRFKAVVDVMDKAVVTEVELAAEPEEKAKPKKAAKKKAAKDAEPAPEE